MQYTVRPLGPLDWTGPKTPWDARRSRYTFRGNWTGTIELLGRELDHLRARDVVLQLAVTERDLRLDGQLRANASPSWPGVRILFESKHGPLTYATDSCELWQHNVRSIALGLQALRAVDRYGITQSGEQYRGWKQLTTGAMTVAEACARLARIAWPNERDDMQARWAPKIATDSEIGRNTYRRARAAAHPDRHGGDHGPWYEVEAAARVLGLLDEAGAR